MSAKHDNQSPLVRPTATTAEILGRDPSQKHVWITFCPVSRDGDVLIEHQGTLNFSARDGVYIG
jgi:hypothetical protein